MRFTSSFEVPHPFPCVSAANSALVQVLALVLVELKLELEAPPLSSGCSIALVRKADGQGRQFYFASQHRKAFSFLACSAFLRVVAGNVRFEFHLHTQHTSNKNFLRPPGACLCLPFALREHSPSQHNLPPPQFLPFLHACSLGRWRLCLVAPYATRDHNPLHGNGVSRVLIGSNVSRPWL